MHIGIVGLGKMGHGVAVRLLQAGHTVVAFNRSYDKTAALAEQGAVATHDLAELVRTLPTPRVVWTYLPAGEVTIEHQEELLDLLEAGDTLMDGGNSRFTDSLAMAARCAKKGVNWVDIGTSGGIGGATTGYCLMIGGSQDVVGNLTPLWEAVAQPQGFARVGEAGCGHYVKMVHNGIEYGMVQAFAEGMQLIEEGTMAGKIDAQAATAVWQHGSIIRSYLGDLVAEAYHQPDLLKTASASVEDNGMARWSVDDGVANAVPLPVLTASLYARFTSRKEGMLSNRLTSAVRHLFGGHRL